MQIVKTKNIANNVEGVSQLRAKRSCWNPRSISGMAKCISFFAKQLVPWATSFVNWVETSIAVGDIKRLIVQVNAVESVRKKSPNLERL